MGDVLTMRLIDAHERADGGLGELRLRRLVKWWWWVLAGRSFVQHQDPGRVVLAVRSPSCTRDSEQAE